MFTGLVSEVGSVSSSTRTASGLRLTIKAPQTASETSLGASININGACQTVASMDESTFSVDTIPETIKKTTLGNLKIGDKVNLEQALRPTDRMGGHIVAGHVDCVGKVNKVLLQSGVIELTITYPSEYDNLLVAQGSIAIDGVSLTVASLEAGSFKVAIIPSTWEMTNLSCLNSGIPVNLEFDIIGKYVARLAGSQNESAGIDEKYLRELGY